MRKLTQTDVDFLVALQEELNTQDTVGQAEPRFWVVLTHRHEPCWEDRAEWFDIVRDVDWECIGRADYPNETDGLHFIPMRNSERIAENTMFLTSRECREHIERNRHNYLDPIPYAMTAWRSPQVERLCKILQEINWDELRNLLGGDAE